MLRGWLAEGARAHPGRSALYIVVLHILQLRSQGPSREGVESCHS